MGIFALDFLKGEDLLFGKNQIRKVIVNGNDKLKMRCTSS